MAKPQPGIFNEDLRHFIALEYVLLPGADADRLKRAAAALTAGHISSGSAVLALGPAALRLLGDQAAPPSMTAFTAIDGGVYMAPATQRDLLVWVKAAGPDDAFDIARSCNRHLGDCAELALEVPGFVYHDSRDLTGFIDGTANPKGDAIAPAALLAGDGPHAGGAFVLTQQWQTDLSTFAALPVPEQEAVIGRTKEDSIELEGDAMPPDSHVSRTDVALDGVAQKIWRRSFPWGGMARHGLYFLAFSCEIGRFDIQLRRMFGATDDGIHDRLVEFTTPVTGAYWFAPSLSALADI
jgi:putative iron-dependent peroxidase